MKHLISRRLLNFLHLIGFAATGSVPIEKLLQYNRAESPGDGFSLTIAPNNAFGLNANTMVPPPVTLPATVNSVAVGYWALLHSLPPGEHTIKFGGSITYPELISGTFRTSVTYLLNVDTLGALRSVYVV